MKMRVTTTEVRAGVRRVAEGGYDDVKAFADQARAEGARVEFQDGAEKPQREDGIIAPSTCIAFYPHADNQTTIYIYSNQTGRQVASIEGRDNAECERLASEQWNSNDYHWSYTDVLVSNAI